MIFSPIAISEVLKLGDKLTDAELVATLRATVCKTRNEAAAELGINTRALQARIALAKTRGLTENSSLQSEEEKLRLKVKTLEAALRAQQKRDDSAEEIRRRIYELAARSPEPPEWTVRDRGIGGKRGIPTMIWSDWHRGEIVRTEEVNGLNEFTSAIHDARVRRLIDTTADLCFNHMGRAKTVYPGAVIMLGGDFINGDIHEELQINADRTTQQNINELTDVLAAAIETCATKFGNVFCPAVVGNHGRNTRKPRMKGRVYTSHEWNIYCNLERYFRRSKHVSFMVPTGSDCYFPVAGTRYFLTHGDSLGVKGGDGIIGAIGPIMRGSIKVGNSEAQVGRDIDCIVMGHWHQPLWLPSAIVNGALKGYDEYARLQLRAPYSRPSQLLWFTHPEHGITAKWEVFLEGRKQAREIISQPGVPDWVLKGK